MKKNINILIKEQEVFRLVKQTLETVSGIEDLSIPDRTRFVADVRILYFGMVHYYLGKEYTCSHSAIYIDRRHATGIHARKNYNNLLGTDGFSANHIYEKAKEILDDVFPNINNLKLKDDISISESKVRYLTATLRLENMRLMELLTKRAKRIEV